MAAASSPATNSNLTTIELSPSLIAANRSFRHLNAMKHSVSHAEAIGFALAGFTFWVLTDTTIKLVGQSGLPPYEIVGFLGFFIALFLIARALWRRELYTLRPHQMQTQLLRSALDLGNNFSVVVALRHLSLTLFYILIFLAPIAVSLMSAIFLREALPWRKALAILSGFAGVVIAINPFGSSRHGDWIGFAACMVCVACFSVNMVWSRVLTQTERPESLTLVSGIAMALVGFGWMLHHAEPLTLRLTAMLIAMGIFCALGSICFFVALKHTAAATVSQFHYTQLVSGALVSYLVWHEAPHLVTIVGAALIIASGLYIALLSSREQFRSYPVTPGVPD